MNSILNSLKEENNIKLTENWATAYKSTLNNVYDLFAFGERIDKEVTQIKYYYLKKHWQKTKA